MGFTHFKFLNARHKPIQTLCVSCILVTEPKLAYNEVYMCFADFMHTRGVWGHCVVVLCCICIRDISFLLELRLPLFMHGKFNYTLLNLQNNLGLQKLQKLGNKLISPPLSPHYKFKDLHKHASSLIKMSFNLHCTDYRHITAQCIYHVVQVCSKAIFGNLGVNKTCQEWNFFEYQLPISLAEALIIATFGNNR